MGGLRALGWEHGGAAEPEQGTNPPLAHLSPGQAQACARMAHVRSLGIRV